MNIFYNLLYNDIHVRVFVLEDYAVRAIWKRVYVSHMSTDMQAGVPLDIAVWIPLHPSSAKDALASIRCTGREVISPSVQTIVDGAATTLRIHASIHITHMINVSRYVDLVYGKKTCNLY
jgi:hypothetical protein